MSTILTLDLTEATKVDPCKHITHLNSKKVKFESNDCKGYSEIMFHQFTIPETATFLLFDIKTKFNGGNPKLGNVNVGIQPPPGESSFFRIVQGSFKGTLALDLATVSGEVPWLGIGFPGGVFGAEEFIATVSKLRFVDDTTVPDEYLRDVP